MRTVETAWAGPSERGRAAGPPAASVRGPRTVPGRGLHPGGWARSHALRLLHALGRGDAAAGLPDRADHPALSWRRSGLMAVTGTADGPGLMAPAALTAAADGASMALWAISGAAVLERLSGAMLLGERARVMRLTRRGEISPGGGSRLLPSRDGWIAVTLVRCQDWDAVPAWLREDGVADWPSVATCVRRRSSGFLVDRGRLLGLAVVPMSRPHSGPRPLFVSRRNGRSVEAGDRGRPLVVDLSALWAGPLCTRLLRLAGAQVIKVESVRRPDGARFGHRGFYDRLNSGKACLAVDLQDPNGQAALRALLMRADIVVEGSRPRALRQIGLDAETIMPDRPGLTWISITGHGRDDPAGDWIGFGDDCAVAAGLAWQMRRAHGSALFCGDAIGDPLTGLHAAVVALALHSQGGGHLASLSLAGTVGWCIDSETDTSTLRARVRRWREAAESDRAPLYPLPEAEPASALGSDNPALRRQWGLPPC
jgi:crotonobetainyl-CoA:carnitine CoA-transferase CaiB-like acyl-CoA transferase